MRPRISLIGPLPPLRGGIPRHTGCLRAALETRADLLTIPFRRLYPQWLFPGETLHEPADAAGVSSPRAAALRDRAVQVDALDPRTWASAVRAVKDHRSERVLMPWWTVAVAAPILGISRACRRAGIPVTFVCHNVVDHEGAWWKRVITRVVLRQGARFTVASSAEAARIRELRPGADVIVYPHPVHDDLPAPEGELPRRRGREFLFFGLIREYKGLDVLIEALARMPDDDWHLTVAGEPWMDLAPLKQRARATGIADRVEWIERYVSKQQAALLFGRADAAILPYRKVTGSAVLALAMGAGKPVVASDIPGFHELVRHGETGWLVAPGDPGALAAALVQVNRGAATAMAGAVRRAAARWTWDALADAVLTAGRSGNEVMSAPPGR